MPPKKKPRSLRSMTGDEFMSLRAKIPFVSQSALAKVLSLANSEELPNIKTGKSVWHVGDRFVRIKSLYESVNFRKEIDRHDIEFQNTFATFWYLCTHSRAFKQLVSDPLAAQASSADNTRVILYRDEVPAGNQVAYKHERKTGAIY